MEPIRAFIAYSHRDERFKQDMQSHFAMAVEHGFLKFWQDRLIRPGIDWDAEIHEHLDETEVFFLLVSSDFLSSRYAMGIEARRAMEMHVNGAARVLLSW